MKITHLYIYDNKPLREKVVDGLLAPVRVALNGRKFIFNSEGQLVGGGVTAHHFVVRFFAGLAALLLFPLTIPAVIAKYKFKAKEIKEPIGLGAAKGADLARSIAKNAGDSSKTSTERRRTRHRRSMGNENKR